MFGVILNGEEVEYMINTVNVKQAVGFVEVQFYLMVYVAISDWLVISNGKEKLNFSCFTL